MFSHSVASERATTAMTRSVSLRLMTSCGTPGWIKMNAGWWNDGSIVDSTFVNGLQWLISNGIMVIG